MVASYKTGIYTSETGKLNIAINKETGGSVAVRLSSADGRVLYSQHLGKNDQAFRTKLNLNELEITNGVDTTTQNVAISTSQPSTASRVIAIK